MLVSTAQHLDFWQNATIKRVYLDEFLVLARASFMLRKITVQPLIIFLHVWKFNLYNKAMKACFSLSIFFVIGVLLHFCMFENLIFPTRDRKLTILLFMNFFVIGVCVYIFPVWRGRLSHNHWAIFHFLLRSGMKFSQLEWIENIFFWSSSQNTYFGGYRYATGL